MKFTGDPVTVMTMSTYDTDTFNAKAVLDIAQGAVVQINNAGGIGGHELKLITCNDSADPNKAADCARQAVDEGVAAHGRRLHRQRRRGHADPRGGRHPVVRARRASLRPSCPARTATRSPPACSAWPVSARWRPRTAATRSPRSTTTCPRPADRPAGRPGADQRRATSPSDADQGARRPPPTSAPSRRRPATTTAPWSARRRSRSSASLPPAPSSAARPSTTWSPAASPTPWPRTAARRSRAPSRSRTSPTLDDPIWDEAKKYVGDLADDENGGWSGLYFQNTWVAYRTFLSLIKNNTDFSAAGVKATLDATTQVDTDGFTPPFSFAEDFPAPGLNRVFNYSELTFEIKDGKLQQDGAEYTDMRLALVPAS